MALKDFSTYFDAGEFLFKEGDRADFAYIIESGSVEISHQIGDRKLVLSKLGEGDVLGEMAVVDKQPRTANAIALEPTRTLEIPIDYISEKIQDADPTVRMILRLIMYRYRDADARLRQVFDGILPIDEVLPNAESTISSTGELKSVMAQFLDMQQRISTAVNMPAYQRGDGPGGEQTLLSTKILVTQDKSIKSALQDEEFHLCFQPIVELTSEKIVGCEALVRWTDSAGKMIMPTQFIPRAESTGLIVELGYWITRKACEFQFKLACQYKDPPFVSINLSGKQFEDKNLINSLADIMDDVGVVHDQVKFEITESLLMDNPEIAGDALKRLKETGAKLAIDDFGTGYSSFNYLHQFPFDTLKIDRSFVSAMSSNVKSNEIVKSLVHLSHDLGMDVVAEGIETNFEVDMLLQHHTDYGQGFYFSKGVTEEEFIKLLK
ncbi:MAG: EAL domain-containing protein [Gammaproteobacteria bacterium]|nr:EAL domain-containing protein [Gammaproteobacteria bacterium]